MGCQGEIYCVLGKRFPVTRVNKLEELDRGDPQELLYRLNGRVISISEDRPKEEYQFLDGFAGFEIPKDLSGSVLGVKVLGVDHEIGDNTFGRPIEALVGYALANESYATHASPLPPMSEIAKLKPRLLEDIRSHLGLEVSLNELELHLLYEFAQ